MFVVRKSTQKREGDEETRIKRERGGRVRPTAVVVFEDFYVLRILKT